MEGLDQLNEFLDIQVKLINSVLNQNQKYENAEMVDYYKGKLSAYQDIQRVVSAIKASTVPFIR
jgi:hypothetical protein